MYFKFNINTDFSKVTTGLSFKSDHWRFKKVLGTLNINSVNDFLINNKNKELDYWLSRRKPSAMSVLLGIVYVKSTKKSVAIKKDVRKAIEVRTTSSVNKRHLIQPDTIWVEHSERVGCGMRLCFP